jgi:hypothetical protein
MRAVHDENLRRWYLRVNYGDEVFLGQIYRKRSLHPFVGREPFVCKRMS